MMMDERWPVLQLVDNPAFSAFFRTVRGDDVVAKQVEAGQIAEIRSRRSDDVCESVSVRSCSDVKE